MRPPSVPTTIPTNSDEDTRQVIIMKKLYNTLIEYREPKTNRIPIQLFMCLPSRKDFPEYFNIITKPIAMNKIRERIERNYYADLQSCLDDFKTMFNNCKIFNEEESQIYHDAVLLENSFSDVLANSNSNHNTQNNSQNNINNNTNTNNTNSNSNNISNNSNNKTINNNTSTTHNGQEDNSNDVKQEQDADMSINDTSMDSTSNLSADVLASTPIEKCSLNTRRGRNPEAPKRQLLTGYIIYASEIRKEVIDKNPNQNFGDISRLVGNEWKALPHDIRSKYDQRALIHNKRVRERALREPASVHHTPNGGLKMTKRKLAKLAKEQMKQHHLSNSNINDESSTQSSAINIPSSTAATTTTSTEKAPSVDSSTQTQAIRFVEPPTRKNLLYSEAFRNYIEGLQVPNKDLFVEEQRPPELPTQWLGAGVGRHESPEAALWALRDFMLQDADTMRRNMQPYL